MSTMTVMDKNIKSSAHVKYPAEKDRPRGAGLNLVASRGTWVSESPEKDRPRGAGLNLVASRGTWVSESLGEHGCLKARGTWVSESPTPASATRRIRRHDLGIDATTCQDYARA